MLKRKSKVQPFGAPIRTGSVGSILAKLYRTILHDLGIDQSRYEALMERYIQRAHLDPDRKAKAAARAGLSKELLKETMTFKTWIKGILFLAVVRVDFGITLHHASGKQTQHGLSIAMDELADDDETEGKNDE